MEQLFERVWPVQNPKGAVVIVHGLAEHSGRYEHVAGALNRAGYSVHAQDLRGHGHSPGFPGQMGGDLEAIIGDVATHAARVSAAHDKTFVLAHSLGTLFAIPAVAEVPAGTVDGLILSGTALHPGPAVLDSVASGQGVPPEVVSRDPEVVRAYVEDPLVFHDRVPSEVMAMATEAIQRATAAIGQILVPVLVLHGSDDELCDLEGANYVHVQLIGSDKTLHTYKELYHEILNEPERDEVLKDITDWLQART